MLNIEMACKNCFFFREVKMAYPHSDRTYTECRKRAPVVNAGDGYEHTCWPMVESNDFCGEFSSAEALTPTP